MEQQQSLRYVAEADRSRRGHLQNYPMYAVTADLRAGLKELPHTKWWPSKAALAAITVAPLAHADPGGDQAALQRSFAQAGGPFVGEWGAHGERVTVNADGTGVETSRYGTTNFTLGSVQTSTNPWDTAYGNVTGGSLERGAFVTIMPFDGGNGMAFSAGDGDGDDNFPFCKIVNGNKVNSYDCGA